MSSFVRVSGARGSEKFDVSAARSPPQTPDRKTFRLHLAGRDVGSPRLCTLAFENMHNDKIKSAALRLPLRLQELTRSERE
ncbi:hypothetical protein GWI33_019366 [Rhynchophorus ferrugineus]|uniref:Uncharacterized protein n=1 Tax=Rhynchophorus ferrugineus TaxID=354439 RepID=A0A834HRK3_RHYFE|nr:hypothetical protein GWI33_019366 [Rhynchophorus ferrugineus]